jgi:hypothetical protein
VLMRVVLLVFGISTLAAGTAGAQYFGRNKVQYEALEFRVLETPHFDIYFYPETREAVEHAARLAERWYERLSRALDHEFRERQPIVLYASHAHFAQSTVFPWFVGEEVGGLTDHQKGRVVMPFGASLGATEHVLGHELVHAFQRDILRQRGRSLATLPLWFVEGMAEHLTVSALDATTSMWLRDAADRGRLPTIEQLDDPRFFPYRYGQALWSYLAGRFGEAIVGDALRSRAPGGAAGRIAAVTGVDVATLSRDWHAEVMARAGIDRPERAVEPLAVIGPGPQGGRLQVAPALSPDGRDVVFLSERDRYSIDVYLADADTGIVKRRIVQTAADAHYDSLQFMRSAGAWDPEGRHFVFAAVHRGQPILTMVDVRTGTVTREIRVSALDEVVNPAWSPDGRYLAFSGMKGGLSDLYTFDLERGTLRALTSDAFADLQPAWSPDGKTIVFATDRFSSSLATLEFGPYRLGVLDVETGAVHELPGFAETNHFDPHYSEDGTRVYLRADRRQRSNVYRLDLATGEMFQITDMDTGVTGITAVSPALSVARSAPRMAFSVYRGGGYEVHVAGTSPEPPADDTRRALRGAVPQEALEATALGRVDGETFSVRPYRRGMSLDRMTQPYLSAGGGSFGSFVRAGVSFGFSDLLEEHALQTAVQVGRGVDDFALRTAYVNRQQRWNWAIVAEQVPTGLSASRREVTSEDGTLTASDVRFRQIHRQVGGVAIYPFNRARRFELGGGVHRVDFDRRLRSGTYSMATGGLLSELRSDTSPASAVTLLETSAALVGDTALSGPAGPILGQRYRVELAPTFGDLRFATLRADYRRYLMPVRPFTVATRLQHLGRYGPDAGDARLLPVAYNLRGLVRGYDSRRLTTGICGAEAALDCAALSYLSTRRLFVANLELRAPIVGALQGTPSYGRLPLEGFIFSDTGRFSRPALRRGDGDRSLWMSSAGAGVRLNAAGVVFELAAARRWHAPGGWTVAINFGPGF